MMLAKVLLWILFISAIIGCSRVACELGRPRKPYGLNEVLFMVVETLMIAYLLFWSGVF